MPRPPPLMGQIDDSDSDGGECADCLDDHCVGCVELDQEKLKSECTKCCVGYVVVCSFNVLFIHSLAAGICVGIAIGGYIRDPIRFSILDMLAANISNAQVSQYIILAAGIMGVIFLVIYVPVRCFALRSAKLQVATDATLLTVLLCLSLSGAFVAVASYEYEIENLFEPLENYVRMDYTGDESNKNDTLWDKVQIGYLCCGAHSAIDYYINTTWWKLANNTRNVPLSCCRTSSDGKVLSEIVCQSTALDFQIGGLKDTETPTFMYTRGCTTALKASYESHLIQMIVVAFIMVALELCGVSFAVYIYYMRNRRSINPASAYIVDDTHEEALFKPRERTTQPRAQKIDNNREESVSQNGRIAKSGREGREDISDSTDPREPQPGSSNTPSEDDKRILKMFAAQNPGYMEGCGIETSGNKDRNEQDVAAMFSVGGRSSQSDKAASGESDSKKRKKSGDRMEMFTASGEKKMASDENFRNGSVVHSGDNVAAEQQETNIDNESASDDDISHSSCDSHTGPHLTAAIAN